MNIDATRREWLVRALVLDARLDKARTRYRVTAGRPLETRQLEHAEAELDAHWKNVGDLATEPTTQEGK